MAEIELEELDLLPAEGDEVKFENLLS